MKKVQQGFTLIELMIVVAIIGILAAVAIPAYQDYTVRAKITEGINAAGAAKASVADYYMANGSLPTNNAAAGLDAAASYATAIIASLTVTNGNVAVAYNNSVNAAIVAGSSDTIVFAPTVTAAGAITWDCTTAGGGSNLPTKYRPGNCRP